MFCRTCGKEILDNSAVCLNCGCLSGAAQPIYQEKIPNRPDKVEAVKVLLSLFISVVGIVLGIIDLKNGRKSGIVYLIIGIITTIIEIILFVIIIWLFLFMFFPFPMM